MALSIFETAAGEFTNFYNSTMPAEIHGVDCRSRLRKRSRKLIGVRLYLVFALGIALALGAVAERSFSATTPMIAFQF